jgi:hypothetical protein
LGGEDWPGDAFLIPCFINKKSLINCYNPHNLKENFFTKDNTIFQEISFLNPGKISPDCKPVFTN